MLRIKKNSFKKIGNFIKHPIVLLLLGGLISFIFYKLGTKDKKPSYYISKQELVAKVTEDASKMSILWDSTKYENLYYIKLIVWNSGKQFIDASDFIPSNPMTLSNDGKIKILSVSTERSSRVGVKFGYKIYNKDSSDSYVNFSLLNNEALEQNDGIIIHVLYSEIEKGNWNFKGRVKGAVNGFEYEDLSKMGITTDRTSIYILWGIIFVLIISRVIVFLVKKKEVVFRNHEVVFLVVLITFTIYLTFKQIYLSIYLPWY
ncbi:hypothetical protein [Prolixibacter denitrificans]|uniref:Uncharacterized protein n=1 Tax=Prolixibacter denitrificans TaxID=1541063 RepID=A0A2P8CFR6_9BACT|nr:hypothetical protein [Prolixibacter denitrificans]PSK83830.1 hypothetical protein CLV93_103246 [Prolixibacter denitrificans]GET23372.1 hypothetical protein JCM18694_36180 [Prolixibacter denitrificans]